MCVQHVANQWGDMPHEGVSYFKFSKINLAQRAEIGNPGEIEV